MSFFYRYNSKKMKHALHLVMIRLTPFNGAYVRVSIANCGDSVCKFVNRQSTNDERKRLVSLEKENRIGWREEEEEQKSGTWNDLGCWRLTEDAGKNRKGDMHRPALHWAPLPSPKVGVVAAGLTGTVAGNAKEAKTKKKERRGQTNKTSKKGVPI